MRSITILVVDDEPVFLELMKDLLKGEGYEKVITEKNPKNVINILEKKEIDLILLDVYMPEINGMELLEMIRLSFPQIPVIMLTAVNTVEIALKAIKLGAYEYLTKPPETERLLLTIRRALDQRILELELESLRSSAPISKVKKKDFSDIISESPKMMKIFEIVKIFAPTDEIILLTGETGTGKDLLTKKIHDLSTRKNKPFIAVNLASISPSLFESELFGYEKGAFTGSAGEKIGYFEAAKGGTIFLDEIGELPKELQGKLLRVIQYGEIYRIGNPKPVNLDIRIIAATNKDLRDAVSAKEFRADLYYRLNRGIILLPPLRERNTDIPLLADYFLRLSNKKYGKKIPGFSERALSQLINYNFPGNIRELENLIFNAVAVSENNKYIDQFQMPAANHFSANSGQKEIKLISIKEAEKEHILSVIKYFEGNLIKASSVLGVSERTLQRRIRKYRQ